MEKRQEKYQPTEDELYKVRKMMTDEQSALSAGRERILEEKKHKGEIEALADSMSDKEKERHLKKFQKAAEEVAEAVTKLRHLDNKDIAAAYFPGRDTFTPLYYSVLRLICALREINRDGGEFYEDVDVAIGRATYEDKYGRSVPHDEDNSNNKYGL